MSRISGWTTVTAKTEQPDKLIEQHETLDLDGRFSAKDEENGLVAFYLSGYARTHDGVALVSQLEELIEEAAVVSANDTSDSASGYILENRDRRGGGYWFNSGYGSGEDFGVGTARKLQRCLSWMPMMGFFAEDWPEKTVIDEYGHLVEDDSGE